MKRHGRDRGQAVLEMAGILPLIVVVMAMLLQMSVATYAVAQAELAARSGARAASMASSNHTEEADAAARASLGTWLAGNSKRSLQAETFTLTIDVPLLFPGAPLSLGSISADATLPTS